MSRLIIRIIMIYIPEITKSRSLTVDGVHINMAANESLWSLRRYRVHRRKTLLCWAKKWEETDLSIQVRDILVWEWQWWWNFEREVKKQWSAHSIKLLLKGNSHQKCYSYPLFGSLQSDKYNSPPPALSADLKMKEVKHPPLSQDLQRAPALSPAPHHPGCVEGSQETPSAAGSHRPEGLKHNALTRWRRGAPQPDQPQRHYLKQTVSHQGDQQLLSVFLPDQGGVLWSVHAGEVKHGHVWLPVVVDGVVQRRQLVVCAEVSGLAGVRE